MYITGKTTSTRNRTSTSWGYDYTIGEDRGYNVKKDDNGYHVEPFYNVSSSGLKPHYSSNTVYEHFESPGPIDSQSQSFANGVNNDTPNGPTNTRSHGTAEWSQRDKDTPTETPFLNVPSGQPRASGKPATDLKDLYLYDSLNIPLPENPFRFPSVPLYYSSYAPVYGPPTGPMYRPQFDPMYRPQSAPMYRPQSDRVYRPQPDPMYRPQSDPMYRPQSDPMYRPQPDPMYRPQSDPMYRPQSDPMYRPQPDPMYRPQPDPKYRALDSPSYASTNNPIDEPQNGQMQRRQNTYSYPTSSFHRIEPYRDY